MILDDSHKSKEDSQVVQKYEGVPKKVDVPGEINKWDRFLRWAAPWLSHKKELGDKYLEAEVRLKEAEAKDKEADAILKLSQAKKIATETADLASKIDEEKAHDITPRVEKDSDTIPDNDPDLIHQKDKIKSLIAYIRAKYGSCVVVVDNDDYEIYNNDIEVAFDLKLQEPTQVLDVLGRVDPYPLVIVKKVLEKAPIGTLLKVLCDAPDSAKDTLPKYARKTGCMFDSKLVEDAGYWELYFLKS